MDLLGWVREDFGIPLIGAHPTGLGADARAATFRGETADDTTYAVKTSTAPQPGLVVAEVLAERGVRGVPAPVRARDGRLTASRGDLALSVVPWVGRRRALEGGMEKAHWHALGRLLAQVHATDTDDPALVGLAVERPGADRLVDRARAMPERLAHTAPQDPVVLELNQLWRANHRRLAALADRAETLASSPAWAIARHVVCHFDAHQGNVVVGDDGQVWLLDWDDAMLAPREADLMFGLGGVLAFAPVSGAERRAFFEGYGTTDWHPQRLAYFQCIRALRDVLNWSEDVLANTGPGTDSGREALGVVRGILSPTGLVAYALGEVDSSLRRRR